MAKRLGLPLVLLVWLATSATRADAAAQPQYPACACENGMDGVPGFVCTLDHAAHSCTYVPGDPNDWTCTSAAAMGDQQNVKAEQGFAQGVCQMLAKTDASIPKECRWGYRPLTDAEKTWVSG